MNKKIIILTIFMVIGMVIGASVYKIYQKHNDNLILVVQKEFLYNAKNCYNASECKNKVVSLKDLYDNKFMSDKLTNPITKKYYSEDSYVNMETHEIKLIS